MKRYEYSYTIIRYTHDRSVGETLNIGVVLYDPVSRFFAYKIETHYKRLSDTFADFNSDQHRRVVNRLELQLQSFKNDLTNTLDLYDLPTNVDFIMSKIWQDNGLSYHYDDVRFGLSIDLETEIDDLYYRFVASQASYPLIKNRSDEDVWGVYRDKLKKNKADKIFTPVAIHTNDIDLNCDYTFRNGRLHILQPLNMDYVRSESIQDKAVKWLGNAVALQGYEDLGMMYLLLGKPQNPKHLPAYNKAKALLDKMPIKHEIVDEEEAEAFADQLSSFLREHGVLKE